MKLRLRTIVTNRRHPELYLRLGGWSLTVYPRALSFYVGHRIRRDRDLWRTVYRASCV